MKTKTNITNQWKSCSIKIALKDYNEISKLIERGEYLNHSDFIRYTIKNELKNYKILENKQNKNIFNKIEDN